MKETGSFGLEHLTHRTADTRGTHLKHHGKCWTPSFVTFQIFRHVFHEAAKIGDLLGWAAPPAHTRGRLLIGWRSSSGPLIGSERSCDPSDARQPEDNKRLVERILRVEVCNKIIVKG